MQAIQSRHPAGAVAMITGELTRYGQSMQCFGRLQVPPGSTVPWIMGVLVAHNINTAFQVVMDNPSLEWAWLMGDDHTYPPDILMKLLDRDVDCIVPLCLNRSPPFDPTIIEFKDGQGRLKPVEHLPMEGGLYKLADGEVCGDAGLLVRRHVLEKIGAPWHKLKKSGGHNAEDREFIERVKAAGFDVHVDLDNPIGHIAPIEFLPVKKAEGWEIRMQCGGRMVADLGGMGR